MFLTRMEAIVLRLKSSSYVNQPSLLGPAGAGGAGAAAVAVPLLGVAGVCAAESSKVEMPDTSGGRDTSRQTRMKLFSKGW